MTRIRSRNRIGLRVAIFIVGLLTLLGGGTFITFLLVKKTYEDVSMRFTQSILTNKVKDLQASADKLQPMVQDLLISSASKYNPQAFVPDADKKFEVELETALNVLGEIEEFHKEIDGKKLKDYEEDRGDLLRARQDLNRFKQAGVKYLKMKRAGDMDGEQVQEIGAEMVARINSASEFLKAIVKRNKIKDETIPQDVHKANRRVVVRMGLLYVIATAFSLVMIYIITRIISDSLQKAAEFASRMESGDLSGKLNLKNNFLVPKGSEIGLLSDALNKTAQRLRDMLLQVKSSSGRVNKVSLDISDDSKAIHEGTRDQADSISRARDNMKQLTSAVDNIAQTASEMSETVEVNKSAIDETIDAVARIDSAVTNLTHQVSGSMATIAQMSACTAQVHRSAGGMAEAVQETSSTINEMLASIEEVSAKAKDMDASVNTSARTVDDMLKSIAGVSSQVERMDVVLKAAFGAMEKLIASVGQVSENSKQAYKASEDTSKVAIEGGRHIQQSIEGMKSIKGMVSDTARKIRELGDSSAQISDIINVIREIADQTNLLALNAAIEAARAGEEGRGFTVVAASIKKLAERSAEATKEIERLIRNMQNDAGKAVDAMDDGMEEVEKGAQLADQAGAALEGIVGSVTVTSNFVRLISTAAEEQSGHSDQVKRFVSDLDLASKTVLKAMDDQETGANRVKEAFEALQGIAEHVKRSAAEQNAAGIQISRSIGALNDIADQLTAATSDQEKGSQQIEVSMENINHQAQDIQEATRRQKNEGERIKVQIAHMWELTRRVSDSTKLQSNSSHQILQTFQSIGEIADHTSNRIGEVKSSSQNLVDSVSVLERLVALFNLEDAGSGGRRELSLVEED